MQEMQKMLVRALGGKDPLEEGMATHSSILAWRTYGQRKHDGLQSIGSQSQTQLKQLSMHTHTVLRELLISLICQHVGGG